MYGSSIAGATFLDLVPEAPLRRQVVPFAVVERVGDSDGGGGAGEEPADLRRGVVDDLLLPLVGHVGDPVAGLDDGVGHGGIPAQEHGAVGAGGVAGRVDVGAVAEDRLDDRLAVDLVGLEGSGRWVRYNGRHVDPERAVLEDHDVAVEWRPAGAADLVAGEHPGIMPVVSDCGRRRGRRDGQAQVGNDRAGGADRDAVRGAVDRVRGVGSLLPDHVLGRNEDVGDGVRLRHDRGRGEIGQPLQAVALAQLTLELDLVDPVSKASLVGRAGEIALQPGRRVDGLESPQRVVREREPGPLL